MYYVKRGTHGYFIARAPRFSKNASVGNLPDYGLLYYDYDDEKRWPDEALRFEEKRIQDDPAALEALHGEFNRRRGAEAQPPWFDDFEEMSDDLELAVEQEPDDDEDYYDEEPDTRPIIHSEQLDEEERSLIRSLASLQREENKLLKGIGEHGRADNKKEQKFRELMGKAKAVQDELINTDFADRIMGGTDFFDQWNRVESMKDVAAQLLFMYGEDRLEAEAKGEKVDEDFFLAGMNLYKAASVVQELLEEGEMSDYIGADDDDYIFPREMFEDPGKLDQMAEIFAECMKNAPDEQIVAEMEESTDWFLSEKGFDLSTLAGLKKAQAWLEKAHPNDAFITEGEIENAMDWHMGEARLDAMLRVVKAKIKRRMGG